MSAADDLIAFLAPKLGTETHVGPWLTVDQERIDRFAHVTGDIQWIHTDPERARRESPYGATVAHGFLTLSLLPCLTEANHPDFFQRNYPGMRLRVNYGLNRVRFPQPVIVGSRLRARTLLKAVEPLAGAVQITYEITVEIEGKDKPACVAEQVVRVYP
ncbi:MaoC family dehydratase [Geobacter sulfurreducens]|jgi:acyl dehydratase|uniref:Dehydratase, NodN/MaoC domain-containing, putative n=1 Tax=Geobacter sulfurreducens (strain ATCC 51573 / DSM 12127 / PCA) TaxID=243231 RepID=Q74GK9_GEOSL|nr:MaoC family dehydratase [Geobacter sulfurreducens]AAR33571.1 dehydratase, NodN/MaoC domain-containing, putative [Geobacter sulfurreducens PCA]ADI83074.1 dehydratase, NodN/MaoC domain-containing, putative [Geobacter sulfurreducens KN400]QVW35509.1 MaoC family dehydratase [Geobacter sulfurreducens]UAC04332.1 MaoC family dehydratase [Geobacter sulfurreducens]UTG92948.1 MaoC family dehydratase [Geobacter sulfurreducens]